MSILVSVLVTVALNAALTRVFSWKGAFTGITCSVLAALVYWAHHFRYFDSPNDGAVSTFTLLFGLSSALILGIVGILGVAIGFALRTLPQDENVATNPSIEGDSSFE